MSTITKEWLQQKIADMEAARDEIPFGLDEDNSNTLAALRIALASLEAEPVAYVDPFAFHNFSVYRAGETDNKRMGREWMWANPGAGLIPVYTSPPEPVTINAEPVAWLWSHRKHPSEVTLVRPEDDDRAEGAHWSGWSCQALYASQPVPVSVPDGYRLQPISEYDAMCAAMLQGAKPVTTKDDDGRYEQDDSPECGWVVTHSGKDYFYREQKDAVMHMNSAVESGRSVSLRSLIPEPVSEPYKLNDPVIPDGWVACSERLPESKPGSYEYLVFESLNNGVHHDYWNVPDVGDDCQFTPFWNHYDRYVTHWMPLPAAPQQEVKSGD